MAHICYQLAACSIIPNTRWTMKKTTNPADIPSSVTRKSVHLHTLYTLQKSRPKHHDYKEPKQNVCRSEYVCECGACVLVSVRKDRASLGGNGASTHHRFLRAAIGEEPVVLWKKNNKEQLCHSPHTRAPETPANTLQFDPQYVSVCPKPWRHCSLKAQP